MARKTLSSSHLTHHMKCSASLLLAGLLIQTAMWFVVEGAGNGTSISKTDIEMIGATELHGGGHVEWHITGEQAQKLREKAILAYDHNRNMRLEEDEVRVGESTAAYLGPVERYIQGKEWYGVTIGGAAPYHSHDTPEPLSVDVKGLIDTPADSTEDIHIFYYFDAKQYVGNKKINLEDTLIAEAPYVAFPDGSFQPAPGNFTTTDLTHTQSLWHRSSIGTYRFNGTYVWWCGDEAFQRYNPDMTDALTASVNLTDAYAPVLSFYTLMFIGPGDEGLVQINAGNGWETLTVINTNITSWTGMRFSLTNYTGKEVSIRFLFLSDDVGESVGWFLDDIDILDTGPAKPVFEGFEKPPDTYPGSPNFTADQNTTIPPGIWVYDNTTKHSGNLSLSDANIEITTTGNNTGNTTTNTTTWHYSTNRTTGENHTHILGPVDLRGAVDARLSFWYLSDFDSVGGYFTVSVSDDNSTWYSLMSTNTSSQWSERTFPVGMYAGGDMYIKFETNYTSNGTGGVWIDDLDISIAYPILLHSGAEGEGVFYADDAYYTGDFWVWTPDSEYPGGGYWSCRNGTSTYPPDMNDALTVVPALDWRFLEKEHFTFRYRGDIGQGDSLKVEISTSPSRTTWTPVATITSSASEWQTVDLSSEMEDYLGEIFYLRFRFVSDGTGSGSGIDVGYIDVGGEVYTGTYTLTHHHYMVGLGSFYSPSVNNGRLYMFRTPAGEIMFYSVTIPAEEANTRSESGDTIQYSSFFAIENPQVLFAFTLLFTGIILYFPKKRYREYKKALPYRYRVLAKKSAFAGVTSKTMAALLVLGYFIPTLGPVFVSGPMFIMFGLLFSVLSAVFSAIAYSSKIKEAKDLAAEVEKVEKKEAPRPHASGATTAPPSAVVPPVVNIQIQQKEEKKRLKRVKAPKKKETRDIQCLNCGEIFPIPVDWHDVIICPACGSIVKGAGEGKEKAPAEKEKKERPPEKEETPLEEEKMQPETTETKETPAGAAAAGEVGAAAGAGALAGVAAASGYVTEKEGAGVEEKEEPVRVVAYTPEINCPMCGETIDVEESIEYDTTCPACMTPLHVVPMIPDVGYNHLLLDSDNERAYRIFSHISRGKNGLCISTTFPDKLRKEHDLEGARILWVTDTTSDREETADPHRIHFEITRAISDVTSQGNGVVLIDGLEYLIIENGFEEVLKFIKKVTDICSMDEATLLVLLDPSSVERDQLTILKKEFDFIHDMTKEEK